jgi:DNA-binding LacI/PurR family transcriptional regulator
MRQATSWLSVSATHFAKRVFKRPHDLSVVGLDNSQLCDWPAYNLTSYAQSINQMLNRALDIIEDGHSGKSHAESISIECEMIIRGSLRLPPHARGQQNVTRLEIKQS